ncbi:hypothetical protein [Weissella confusa]
MSKLLERTWFKMLIGVAWFFVVYNMVSVGKSEWKATRLLEDDMVNMYGTNMGLQTYSSTMGGKITVPCLIAKFYEITE